MLLQFFDVKKDLVCTTARILCYNSLQEVVTSTGYNSRKGKTDEDYAKHKLYQALMINKFTIDPGQTVLILEKRIDLEQETYWYVLVGEKFGWLNPRFGLWTHIE